MKNIDFKKWMPHISAILLFIAISIIFLSPLLEGKKLHQGDIMNHKGMAKEIVDFREANDSEPLWTNSMFGGMPAFQISVLYPANLLKYIDLLIIKSFPRPAGYIFLYLIGFYILLLSLRVNPWTAIIGAVAFAFSSYYIIIIEAGHNSKAHAIGYIAPVLAGTILTFKRKYLLGGVLFSLALALQVMTNHLQITYYLAMMLFIYAVIEFASALKNKETKPFFTSSAVLLVAGIFAIGVNITNLWTTYEYGKYSTRGKSELTLNSENQTTGLDKDYATNWSYGVSESFTLLVPNFKGGASGLFGNNETALNAVDPQMREAISQQNQYFGDQPFVSGPTYAGAIICFLFILGCFIVRGKIKWFIIAATLMSLFLGWGKNFMPLTDLFLDYVPGYNKFRTVSMIMIILELTIPLMAILALVEIFKKPAVLKEKLKALNVRYLDLSFVLTGGLALLFWLLPTTFNSFVTEQEDAMISNKIAQYQAQGINNPQATQAIDYFNALSENLESARIAIFRADSVRSFIFILLAFIFIWLYGKSILKKNALIALLGLLILLDMWTINKRYLNEDNFVSNQQYRNEFAPSAADKFILSDKGITHRTLNLSVSTFNDSRTSYHHHSIGGYHGAKLKRYQEVVDHQLGNEIRQIMQILQGKPTVASIQQALANTPVINMLNTKYLIYHPQAKPIINMHGLGSAWFVNNVQWVDNANEEITQLGNIDPAHTALVDIRYKELLTNKTTASDSNASIVLKEYQPNHLVYQYNSSTPQTVVFSEIFYDAGWNAYINGEETPHYRTNYILRGMQLPKGNFEIVFTFEPSSYYIGEKISLISSILLIAGSLVLLFIYFTKCKRKEE